MRLPTSGWPRPRQAAFRVLSPGWLLPKGPPQRTTGQQPPQLLVPARAFHSGAYSQHSRQTRRHRLASRVQKAELRCPYNLALKRSRSNVYWTRSPCGPILKNGSACSLIGKPGGWFHRSNRRRGFQVAGEAAPLPGTTTFPAPSGLEFPEGSAISTSSPAGVSIYPAKRGALLWTRWEAGGPRTVAFTASPTKPPDHERRDVGEGGGDLARQTGAPPPCGASRAVRSSGDTPY